MRKKLHRHGSFERGFCDEQGRAGRVSIQRMRCVACGRTFSLLYDFLIPYRRYTVSAFELAALSYMTQFCSYAEALWSSVECESEMVRSTLFRIVAAMTEQVWLAQQQLQRTVLEAGMAVPAVEAVCENAVKAHTPKKCVRLDALAKLFVLAQMLLDMPVLESLHRLFATSTEYKFSLLNTRKNLRLSAPHYRQRAPF